MVVSVSRLGCLAIYFTAAFPALAFGHAALLSPPPRTKLTLKTGPCGGIARTKTPFVAEAGSQLEVTWDEYVDHPGYFRILFSSANDKNFVVLLDHIADKSIPPGQPQVNYSAMVTLPAEPCEAGTLQLIQVMTENPSAPSLYFSCADVKLVAPPGGPGFVRGDANSDGGVDVADAVFTLFYLFAGQSTPTCLDAADANDDGAVDVVDAVALLGSLFLGAGALPAPAAPNCAPDPTDDDLPACGATCP